MGTTFQVPRSLKIFGPKEQSRNYLGDLIHALRSHVPCTYLLKSDSLFCGETVPCLRNADRMCHMHGCHSRGRCEVVILHQFHFLEFCPFTDPKCRYAWKLISHWYKCTNELCFICSPWVKPDLVDGQSRIFLNEIFGVEPLFKAFDFLFREYVFETSEPVVENPPVVSEDEKEDSKSTDFEIDIRPPTTCVSLGVQASFGALEVSKVPIQASCTVL
ncbi:hypothetical protein COOONC_28372 [Cooperia oncophora]